MSYTYSTCLKPYLPSPLTSIPLPTFTPPSSCNSGSFQNASSTRPETPGSPPSSFSSFLPSPHFQALQLWLYKDSYTISLISISTPLKSSVTRVNATVFVWCPLSQFFCWSKEMLWSRDGLVVHQTGIPSSRAKPWSHLPGCLVSCWDVTELTGCWRVKYGREWCLA